MFDLIIVGAGGFGRELFAMLGDVFSSDEYRFKGFLAQEEPRALEKWQIHHPVLAAPEDYEPEPDDRFLLAIGAMNARQATTAAIQSKGGEFISFIHPQAFVASTAEIGAGAVIYPFATVSNSAKLGPNVHLNYYASVGHDCQVGPLCLLAPYATLNGFVTLEDQVYISTHGTVAPGCTMKRNSKLSANSACMRDAAESMFVFGVPGRQVPRMDS